MTDLTDAQRERFTILIEECSEVIKEVSKVLRHGRDSYHPDDPTIPNHKLVTKELADVLSIARDLYWWGDITEPTDAAIRASTVKREKWMHHKGK